MAKCIHHPKRDSLYQCQKHGHNLCDKCLKCKDSDLYCKFRTSCVIVYLEKNGEEKTKN